MKTRSFLFGLIATLILLSVAGHYAEGTISAVSGYKGGITLVGGGFTPQANFTVTGTIADGGSITISDALSRFGTKPYAAEPLVWASMETTLDGSALGRISGSTTWKDLTGLAWASSCGPSGTGCASGSGSPGDGGTGLQFKYTGAIWLNQWSGWASQNSGNGYYVNSLGQQLYVYRKTEHVGFGHLDEDASGNSYNSLCCYNTKSIRLWSLSSLTSGSQAYPDIYWPPSDMRFVVEGCPGSSCAPGISAGPQQYINATTTGSPDVTGDRTVSQAFDGMTSGSGAYNNWITEEFYFHTNSTTAHSPYPPDTQFKYSVVGINSNSPIETWPVSNYQNSSPGVNWLFADSSTLQANGQGTIMAIYAMHWITDGSSGCPGSCFRDQPAGSYVNYGSVYVDDSLCHVVVQDSSTYNSATAREIQIPSAWASGSITITLHKGAFSGLSGKSLFAIDCSNNVYYIGGFTLIKVPQFNLIDAANDDVFYVSEAA